MKYLNLYLDERQKEIEQLKQKEIDEFKEKFRNCEDNAHYESLIEDVYLEHYTMIYDYNMRLQEIEILRNDLILKEDLESKGE